MSSIDKSWASIEKERRLSGTHFYNYTARRILPWAVIMIIHLFKPTVGMSTIGVKSYRRYTLPHFRLHIFEPVW